MEPRLPIRVHWFFLMPPHLLLIMILCSSLPARAQQTTDGTDCIPLVALRDHLLRSNTLPAKLMGTWNQYNCCAWVGVDCTYGVMELRLPSLNLTGAIPPSLVDIPDLLFLDLSQNKFAGTIPPGLWSLRRLHYLNLSWNNLSGPLAKDLVSPLNYVDLSHNSLNGTLDGISFGNSSSLVPQYLLTLSLSSNRFHGSIPESIGLTTPYLQELDLSDNEFDSYHANLTFCPYLRELDLSNNGFSLNGSLSSLPHILESLRLRGNEILGDIPFGMLVYLRILDVGNTSLSGTIPSSLNSLTSLSELKLDHNNLYGGLTLASLPNLQVLDASCNHLDGPIPVHTSRSLVSLNLSHNAFNGTLSEEIGHLPNLITLDVSYNHLSGEIPLSLNNCKLLEFVILQRNNLSGHIPDFFGNLQALKLLDLSFNDLEGKLPTGGIFSDPSRFRIEGNVKLCRDNEALLHMGFCVRSTPELDPTGKTEGAATEEIGRSGSKALPKAALAMVAVSIFFSLVLFCLCYKYTCFINNKSRDRSKGAASLLIPLRTSYADLRGATEGFSSANLIGSGAIGSVYRGYLGREKQEVAVKVFHKETLGDSRSFIRECQIMRNVLHCNLVKILSSCAKANKKKNQSKALVYEFMPNGNLEMWLHQDIVSPAISFKRWVLRMRERLGMAIDVASALVHLHGQPERPIVHGNLKPSNVLISADMTASVTDFGMNSIFPMDAVIATSSCYVAPEYKKGSPMDPRWDVYSFGVLLLEMFTGKRPTDGELKDDNMSLHDYVLGRYVPNVEDVIDPLLLSEETVKGKLTDTMRECFISIIHLALICSEELPEYRTEMQDALEKLQTVKKVLQIGIDVEEETIGSINPDDVMV